MSRTTPWLALLLVTTAACSEGDGPVDVPLSGAFDEVFSMTLPSFQQLTVPTSESFSPSNEAPLASTIVDPSEIPEDFRRVLAGGSLIVEPSVTDAGFQTDHDVAFGIAYGKSIGNYYQNKVSTTLRYNGSQVATHHGEESAWSFFHLPISPWGDAAVAKVGFSGDCGHEVRANSTHTAELRLLAPTRFILLESQTQSSDDSAFQPPCSGGSNPNGGGGGDDEQWYICYWVDVYDANGDFLYRQDLGCDGINVS